MEGPVTIRIVLERELPVLPGFHSISTDERIVSRHKLLDAFECCFVSKWRPAGKDIRKSHRIQGPGNCQVCEDSFYL